jgi:hypothetical protein
MQAREFCKFVTRSSCLFLFSNCAQRVKLQFISVVYLVSEADSNHRLVTRTIIQAAQYHVFNPIQPPCAAADRRPWTVCITGANIMKVRVHPSNYFNNFMTNDGCWVIDEELLNGQASRLWHVLLLQLATANLPVLNVCNPSRTHSVVRFIIR